jgi:hypothetical protein
MATIVLNYNARNKRAVQTLDYIMAMGFFKSQTAKPSRKAKLRRENDRMITHFASEAVLSHDWLQKQEDEAWRNL